MMKNGVCPSEMPINWLIEYGIGDVNGTHDLFLQQRTELYATQQHKVFYTKCIQTPILTDIEFNGMCLDKEKVIEIYEDYYERLEEANYKLSQVTGGLNPRSGKQMGEFIYVTLGFDELKDRRGNPIRTNTGKYNTSAATIASLKAVSVSQRRFLTLKAEQVRLNSAVTKTLQKFYDCVMDTEEGILYASINQSITKTGRYSSNGKNYACQFQNFAREFKHLFRARHESWGIGEADEAQLEFRAAVYFGQDSQGFRDVKEHADVHQFTADVIGCTRQTAKAHTFKPLYGGMSGSKKEVKYYKAFREKYQGVTEVQDGWVQTAVNDKKLVLDTGQIFYFPNLKFTESGYIEGNTNVRNYPIQYLATAEIVPIALVAAWYIMKSLEMKSFIVNTIHDSIIAEVHPDERELFNDIMVKVLNEVPIKYLKDMYGIDFNVELEAEIKINKYWGSDK